MHIKYNNLSAGKYKMQFEIGIHDFGMQTMNYDIVQNMIFFNVTHITKQPEEILYNSWSDWYGHILFNQNCLEATIE